MEVAAARRGALLRVLPHLEGSPALVPALVGLLVLLWLSADEGGFRGTSWMPATLLLLALLIVALAALPRPRPSRSAVAAMLLLGGYAVWSALSILWAEQQELAWEGALRTLLYALVLSLFALWPIRGRHAAVVLGGFGLGVAAIGLVEVFRVGAASQAIDYFHEGRFTEPVGYVNANVALWFSAFWPCVVLAGRREVPVALRGLFLGSAGLLAGLALLGQSRGWFFALPVMAVLAVALVPGRVRTVAALAAVAVAIAAVLQPLLDMYDGWEPFRPLGANWDTASRSLLVASTALVVVGVIAALLERRLPVSERTARRASVALVAALALACTGAVVGYAVVERSPVSAAADAWDDFKRGGEEPSDKDVRFGSTLATYRYDYWRVAWESFERQPVRGIGADNFQREYRVHGRSRQTPRYPHSVELRTLAQTGIIGVLLLGGALAAALVAAAPALRQRGLGGAAAGAGVLLFAYWLVHGSLDWLWEFPALSGAAFMGLGVAVAVAAGRRRPELPPAPLLAWRPAAAGAGAGAVLLAAAILPPWLAERELRRGVEVAAASPATAIKRLERAARLNPLSPVPDKAAGIVELRRGRLPAAERAFRRSLERDPGDSGAYLWLGAIASALGRQDEATSLLRRGRWLAPRNPVVANALAALRDGERLDPARLDTQVSADLRRRIGRD